VRHQEGEPTVYVDRAGVRAAPRDSVDEFLLVRLRVAENQHAPVGLRGAASVHDRLRLSATGNSQRQPVHLTRRIASAI
jgi:hypothetical protein